MSGPRHNDFVIASSVSGTPSRAVTDAINILTFHGYRQLADELDADVLALAARLERAEADLETLRVAWALCQKLCAMPAADYACADANLKLSEALDAVFEAVA